MDKLEVKVFTAIARLRNSLGEFVIELKANREEVMKIVEENLDDIIAKVGEKLNLCACCGEVEVEASEDNKNKEGKLICPNCWYELDEG